MRGSDFGIIYSKGISTANRLLVAYRLGEPNTSYNKSKEDFSSLRDYFGIVVSKKIGNSIIRHHVTRLIREGIRHNSQLFHENCKYIIIARKGIDSAGYAEVESAIIHIANKLGNFHHS